ncbi:dockerin type I domain-containing protein [Anatilimnocola floriformis]|uniref:dockerin type I domain-containing protein n=1 Tax=Anatilimnocola floriformis TaxID=2948575 RepID=UPI0020C3CF62|nr:dockerin type I domain-containing protein [Anatilimnocola floriformis]
MSTRRSVKQPLFKSTLKKDPKYREMLRRAARKHHLESLEDRQMFAIDPVIVQADGGAAFGTGTAPMTVRNESPRELTFTFSGVPGINRTTLASGITLTGANKDNLFNANDITYTPAYLDIGENQTQVVMRFATPLPDDLYRIQFVGGTLLDTDGLPFNKGTSFNVDFRLNLAPQILSIVPQPIDRSATGQLTQRSNQVDVYFNNDDLDPVRAIDPQYYRLLVTRGTVDPLDDAPSGSEILPSSITYDPIKDKVTLTFAQNIETYAPVVAGVADPAVAFRLRIGTNEIRRPNMYGVTGGGGTTDYLSTDPGSTFDGAANLKNVLARGLTSPQTLESFINQSANSTANTNVLTSGTSVIIGQSIDPQYYNLIWPGGDGDPGHRDVSSGNHPGSTVVLAPQNRTQTFVTGNDDLEDHLGFKYAANPIAPPAADADKVNGITTYYYNFRSELGYVPDTTTGTVPSQPTFNIITERQKQRAREVLEVIGQYSGVNFVETEKQGFIIATGDMRSILSTVQTGAGGLTGLAGTVDLNNDGIAETAAAIMDSGEDWASNGGDLYGNAWFVTAMHEIQELLGLGHSYDLPAPTVQGNDPTLNTGLPAAEPAFPGDADIEHMQHVYRPESKDIDLYKFDLDQAGVFTAEVFAERLANSSQLDSALSIYRLNPVTQQPELYARNDDYFSKDSFIELELPAGTYFVGVSASGNSEYDPNVFDSGMGGTTQGVYQLKLDFRKVAQQTLTDNTGVAGGAGVAFDGDSDGKPGGVNNFWFRAAASVSNQADLQSTTRTARTIFVDRAGGGNATALDVSPRDGDPDSAAYVPDGSLAKPFLSIKRATEASKPGDIIRIVGNNLNATKDTTDTNLTDNLAYQIGFDQLGKPLADGSSLDVPKDRTVMIDAGAVLQLRRAQISVGSENQGLTADRSGGALQVLGTPWQNVYFTSYNRAATATLATEPQIGKPENAGTERADEGDWGGIAFRNDIDKADGRFDYETRGIFLNYVSNADIRYGGGAVVVNSTARTVNPIHMTDSRPTIINNKVTYNADAAMSANPDSFEESNFSSPQFGSTFNTSFNVDYNRVGPEIHGNTLTNNTVNALSIRARTQSGALNANSLEEMTVAGRFDDTDIVHVVQENLVLHSNPGGALVHSSLSAPGTTLTVAAPVAGTGGFAAGSQAQIEYKIVYVDENGNEGLASNTVKVTGTITAANSYIRLTNLPNVTASLLAQGFVGRRLYRRIGGTGDFSLVEQIPASSSSTYTDKNIALPTSALKLKVASATDTISPRVTGVTVTAAIGGGQYAAGQRVVYGLAYVDTEGRDTPMVEVPLGGLTLGPNGSVTLANLPVAYAQYMGLRVYRSIAGGQFDLVGLVDAGATTFVDTGAPLAQPQVLVSTVDIVAAQAGVPAPAGTTGFTNGQVVNYRFTYSGVTGETASAPLAVTAGDTKGFVAVGNNRMITLTNLPAIDAKRYTQINIYRSIDYGRFEYVGFRDLVDQQTAFGFSFQDRNGASIDPSVFLTEATISPPMTARARPHGTLVIDPSIVMKSDGARIDATIGTSIIAEGVTGRNIVMTSMYDTRYGAGGTFATSKSVGTVGTAGDWAGIYFAPDSKGSFNNVVFAYGGGENRIEGTFTGINVLEIQGGKVRVANSRFENNADGSGGAQSPADRSGRGTNDSAVIFVRGAQPVIVNNTAVNNKGSFISINVNALNSFGLVDWGRQTGLLAEIAPGTSLSRINYPISRMTDTTTGVTDVDNNGPLVRLNRLAGNTTNGMRVRGGVLTTESVWDDTDIAHVLFDSVLIPDFHTFGGLRLESSARESLVVKSASNTANNTVAAIIANGRPLETEDRIGGTLQVLGQPGFPVVLTAYSDDTISAGFRPDGQPQKDTNEGAAPGGGGGGGGTLPTGPEVNNGLLIDDDVPQNTNGHFAFQVGAAGSDGGITAATAQGTTGQFIAQDFIFDYYPVVYAGGAVIDLATTVTVAPALISPDVVKSEGQFTRQGGAAVHWVATSSFTNGVARLNTVYDFTTVDNSPLGDIRLISYLDEDIQGISDDLLYIAGSPGADDFRLMTLDNQERIGFAQGGVYNAGQPGLSNATYVGFMADQYNDLQSTIQAGTATQFAITPSGTNIDLVDLPLLADPVLGNIYGLNDITTALAWQVNPQATTSQISTFLEFLPQAPVTGGTAGEWEGIVIDKYANDRNVETVPEREPVTSNGSQNSRPSKAQFLGSLNSSDKGGDENLRLGFVVQGAISAPSDVDIYSFKAKSETEVWFDIDRTSQSLDSVLELVDEFGNVLARSDNSADEAVGGDSLIGEGALPMQKTAPYDGVDLYSTNVRDAGMRIKLPGPPGVESTYFVRVRSVPKNKVDLDTAVPQSVNESLVTSGVSYGAYELQVRLREEDEKGGTTVRYGRIANATTGIDVNGHPTHSPLGGEQREVEPNDLGTLLGAQDLGNLLETDRGTIAIAGNLSAYNDVDWYRFSLDYTAIDGTNGVQKEYPSLQSLVNTVFDLDYADGLGRANMQMFVYNSNFELILSSRDSNVADDRSNANTGSSLSDLSRGSTGYNDPYIGNVALPASTPFSSNNGTAPQTYYVAVTSIGTIPTVMDQFTSATSANALLRLEPIDSVHRIVEDHINEGLFEDFPRRNVKTELPSSAPDRGTSDLPTNQILFDNLIPQVPGQDSAIPWTLNDLSMYILRDPGTTIDQSVLQTFDPFTGAHMTDVGTFGYEVEDIDFSSANTLYGLTSDNDPDNIPLQDDDSGHLIQISTANGAATDLGDDGIFTYEFDPTGAPIRAHLGPGNIRYGYGIHYDAMSFFNPNGGATQRILGVGRRGEAFLPGNVNPGIDDKTNIVYQLSAANGSSLIDLNTPRTNGAGTDAIEMGVILTEQRFTAVEATTNTGLFYVPNVLDGTTFSVSDGQLTQPFEFDAGFEVSQTVNNATDQTVRDGYFFILDPDSDPTNKNEKIFQYDTGPVINFRRTLLSTQIPDGSTFTVNANGAAIAFEYDRDGVQNNPTAIPIDISSVGPALTADVVATLTAQAINSQTGAGFPAQAAVSPGSTRISLIPTGAGFVDATILSAPLIAQGVTVQGSTGNAPVLQAVSSPAAGPGSLEGKTFTLQISGATTTFEFDPQGNGVTAGNVAVAVGYNQTSDQVAQAMTNAILTQNGYAATRFGDRVLVNGAQITYVYTPTQPIVDLMDTIANGGLQGIPIVAEENFTNQQLTTVTTAAVNNQSQFTAGGEAATRTSRINFPPITIAGVKAATRRIDITGNPLWTQQLGSQPGVSPGAVAIPFLAEDDRFAIAQRVEAAIDGNMAGFNATATGAFVTLDRGQISLPTGSPFAVAGAGPGGNITGIVNVSNPPNGTSTFVAISDRGGLYLVTVNHNNNIAGPSNNTVNTQYIGTSENDLKGIQFQGLTRGPANVEGGRYANTWFAVADSGPFVLGPTVNFAHTENNGQIGLAIPTGITATGASTAILPAGTGVIGDGPFGGAGQSGDYDFYSFQAGAGQTITIDVEAAGAGTGTLADSYLTLYNAAGQILAADDNGGTGLDSSLTYTIGAAGTYYFAVRGGGFTFGGDLRDPFVASTGRGTTFTGTYGVTVTKEEFGASRVYAFDYNPGNAYNGLQPIFVDGQSNVPLTFRQGNTTTPIYDAKGIHFSELDRNLWHITPFDGGRATDPGHGVNANENDSRDATNGHSSFYFGGAATNGNYNFNNGADGSIISNEFSLEGYSAIDQPMLYFSYFADHDTVGTTDSFRVFVSGINNNNADVDGDGIADTNSGDWWPVALDDQTSVVNNVDNANTYVTTTESTFTTAGWRQVRIPLDRFAGWKDLRIKMDFSTAGDMATGVAYTKGEELRTVAGEYITDGQYISIDGQLYELDSGISATFASGNATPDGEALTVTAPGGASTTFEFDKDGVVTPGRIAVPIHDLMTAIETTQSMLSVLTANGFGGQISYMGDDAVLNFYGSENVTVTNAPSLGEVTFLTGQVGLVQPGAIEIPYQRAWTKIEVANSVNNVLEREFYDQKLIVGNGSQYADGQTFTITDVTDPLATQTFEIEMGQILNIPVNGANNLFPATQRVNDGDDFTLTYTVNGVPTTIKFEYDSDAILNDVTATRIPFNVNDTQSKIATVTTSVLNFAFPGLNAQVVTGARVQFDTDSSALTTMTYTPSITPAVAAKYSITGANGVTGTNVPVYVTASPLFATADVAAAVASAINSITTLGTVTATTAGTQPNRVTLVSANEYNLNVNPTALISFELTNVVANNNVKQYGDLIRLISSPTGPQHTLDYDPITDLPLRGPFGFEAALPGDNGGFRSNARGQNNAFEGVYVDDFIVGLAERGEMATGDVTRTQAFTTTQPALALPGQIRTGDYTLEIRRGVGYDFVSRENPGFTPDSNDRFTSQQTILARAGADIIDGQTFTLSDGNRQLTFEFNDIFEVNPDGDTVTPGNQEIPYHSGMKDFEVAEAIRDAINNVNVQQIIDVNAWMGDGVQPGLFTTTNRVNLNGAVTFVATGVPVTERNENIATAMEITAPGIPYDGLRFFANGMIGDSDDSVTSQLDAGRRDRDVDYFALDLEAGQRIIADVDAADAGSTLDSYMRIFNQAGVLQTVSIGGVTYTAENDGPTIPMLLPNGTFSNVTYAAPGERGNPIVIGNTATQKNDTDSALDFIAPVAGRYIIAVSGATNNRYNPVTGGGTVAGSTGKYTLEVTSPNATGNNSAGVNSAIDVISYDSTLGDGNLPRDQGQIILQGNEIYNSVGFGIDVDAGSRSPNDANAAHQGGVRNLAQSNVAGLLPGVVIMNNVIYGNGLGAIHFSGDAGADAPVPYGRIINNTLYGVGGTVNPPPSAVADVGILVDEKAGPTLLNNIIANFNTGISVDATSRPNTVIGGVVTQGNGTQTNPANLGLGDFPIQLTNTQPLFRNAPGGNFYLDALSPAIDSSVDSLLDRPLMVTIKAPLGLGASPILSPDRDARGQVRADDPNVQTPQGFGLNPFKDRGAIDRVDKVGPSSGLVNPQDNDSLGIDRDSSPNVVSTDGTQIVRNFTIALFDRTDPNGEPDGSDIDDFTVTTDQVIVTRLTGVGVPTPLVDGVDYFFSYDSTSNQIVLTPVGNIWPRGTYRVYLNDGILDQAGNPLTANNDVALPNPNNAADNIDHYYDIFLGTAVDYGDAPANYPVLEANGGASHFIVPGVSIGATPSADFDGKPSAAATLDSDDGVVSWGQLLPGVADASSVTVNSPTSGLKLSMWIDVDGTPGWSTAERVIHNYVLQAGNNTIVFTIPIGQRGPTYARLRVSSQDIDLPTGPAIDGEVEDYQVTLTGAQFQNGIVIKVDRADVPGNGLDDIGNMDVNNDGRVNAFDAIIVINYLNLYPSGALFPIVGGPSPLAAPPPYLDVDGNGRLSAFDVIPIITYLNANPLLPVRAGAPESTSVGGGAAPEHAGESIEADLPLALNGLAGEMYASSSVIIETKPVAAPQPRVAAQAVATESPVDEMMNAVAVEAAMYAMAERNMGWEAASHSQPTFEAFEEMAIPTGPLTDGQWADLLDELAQEQTQQS